MAAESAATAFIVTLPGDETGLAAAEALLSADEQQRADRFHLASDRAAYIYGHAALRILLGSRLRRDVGRAPFERRDRGKPFIRGTAMGFSFSRSGRQAAVALIDDGDIGVDVEAIAVDNTDDEIASAYYSADEQRWIDQAQERSERRRRVYRLWVIGEALAKATGEGLGRELHRTAIGIDGDVPALMGGLWRACEAPAVDGFAAAVVVPRQQSVSWEMISWHELA